MPLPLPFSWFSLRKPTHNSLILRRARWDRRSLFVVCRLFATLRSTTGHTRRWPVPPAVPLQVRRLPGFPTPFHHDAVVARALRLSQRLCVSAGNRIFVRPQTPGLGPSALRNSLCPPIDWRAPIGGLKWRPRRFTLTVGIRPQRVFPIAHVPCASLTAGRFLVSQRRL